jgi:hypothetical protein
LQAGEAEKQWGEEGEKRETVARLAHGATSALTAIAGRQSSGLALLGSKPALAARDTKPPRIALQFWM